MSFNDQNLVKEILAFVREQQQASVIEIREKFGDEGLICAGIMTAKRMLVPISGGGEEPYVLTLGD